MIKEYLKMVVVLTLIAMVCGFLLSAVKTLTHEKIEQQILVNVKGPALNNVLSQSTNNPIDDRMNIELEGITYTVFIGKKEDRLYAVAFESEGNGFGGKIGIMIGIDIEKSSISGIGILTHQETPGLGSRISEMSFTDRFKGKFLSDNFKVKKDSGDIDAISGATNSSRGVCSAVESGVELYSKLKAEILIKIDKGSEEQ
ncbi:MAG: RnfABCDGE type electron transport complex subunit G [Acidobacteriota bacterium]